MKRRAVLLVCLAVASADDESALYFLGRAKDALAAGDIDRAAEFLQKSAKEKEGYAPTLVMLAEVAKRRGDRETALRHLETCLQQRQRSDLSASEKEALAAAEKMLAEIDEARGQFLKLVADHVADLRKLATTTKDQSVAKECWRTILLVDPKNEEARARLAPPAPQADPVKGSPLLNGKDLDEWSLEGPDWIVADGILTCRSKGGAGNTCKRELTGDYALVCEMRVKEETGPDPLFGIVFAMRGEFDHFGLWIGDSVWRLGRQVEATKRSDLQSYSFKRLSKKFASADWHKYRIEVQGKRIRCTVDDRELWDFAGADREIEGHPGLWVRGMEVEVRSFVVEGAE